MTTTLRLKIPINASTNGNLKRYQTLCFVHCEKTVDILLIIDNICCNLWSNSTTLHCRYGKTHQNDDVRSVFLIKGLGANVKGMVCRFQKMEFPIGLVTTAMIYASYNCAENTYVDQSIEKKLNEGLIRRFDIFSSRYDYLVCTSVPNRYHSKYDVSHIEFIVKEERFQEVIDEKINHLLYQKSTSGLLKEKIQRLEICYNALKKFKKFTTSYPKEMNISLNSNFDNEEITTLISMGFLIINTDNISSSNIYLISCPNSGVFTKILNSGRTWIVKTLQKKKNYECLEDNLFDEWNGTTPKNKNNIKNFKKPFYGFDLTWLLSDSYGNGIINFFETSMGTFWKLKKN